MGQASMILGMNARNRLYLDLYNKSLARRIANAKLLTKNLLRKNKLPRPRLFKVFRRLSDLENYRWEKLGQSFVLKPNRGLGGEGIIVVERGGEYAGEWITSEEKQIGVADLKLQVIDILQGRYSLHNVPDIAFVEERIPIHPFFEKYAWKGTPDIRVIVFNRVPVMAMLRLPTRESGGRANLHQGAIGVGIDIGSGVTIHAIHHNRLIVFVPGTRRKLRGLRIPHWDEVLKLAVQCQIISKLGYLGADILLHPEKGPMVLELNAQPGLKIQNANLEGLKKRLERVEGLRVDTAEKGVKIAKALFADPALMEKVGAEVKVVPVFNEVEIETLMGERVTVKAKIDTGAWRTSIDAGLARSLGLLDPENILWEKKVRSALGRKSRPVIGLIFYLAGKKVKANAAVTDRAGMKRPMIVGRQDLRGFLVKPGK